MPISKSTSIYLNLVRWFSAAGVVLYHLQIGKFGPEWLLRYFPTNGHGFVTVFFVISGFVVSMAAEQKTAIQFAIDRSARIYIVAIPALLMSIALSLSFHSAGQGSETISDATSNFLLNVVFLGQSWSLNLFPPLNSPYWSLSYEVMYYLAFGCFVYARGIQRWLLAGLIGCLAGPKILVLFPCWLAGVAAYKSRNGALATQKNGWLAAIGAPLFLAICVFLGLKAFLNELSDKIAFHSTTSEAFLKSWLLAALYAIHLWGICQIKISFPTLIGKLSSKLAGMSYSLYLSHFPIIYTIAFLAADRTTIGFLCIELTAVFIGCYIFSRLTEAHTKAVRDRIGAMIERG